MIYVLGSHPVKDFDTWKPYFDADQVRAKNEGIICEKVFRSTDDPNLVSFLFSAPSKEKVHEFFTDPNLGEVMQKAGVLAPPTIQYFNLA